MSSDTTTPAELRAEIAQTRADLGETAAALAAKTDVKARVRARAAGVAGQTTALAGTVRDRVATTVRRPVPVAVIAAVATAATVALVLIRRSHR
ncbi:hypothetical protein GCM10020358_78500 [Amorphoplanes nipponensis]|uniref:DUF3618 domain-containing protein n=1 Tax=Actinoplanes nipponensis TaxID=135950 RepID=A0A919MQ63_9ACTN|nr:DUF3618 domain-containing protein [Actinoplanes nipponensis]GIE52792.1 hypothetical protein Ani05nite_63260 [Actinoplanes nipponensis]